MEVGKENVAYIICCNDEMEFVVLNNEEEANKKLLELEKKDYQRRKYSVTSKEAYKNFFYWHLHMTGYIIGEKI